MHAALKRFRAKWIPVRVKKTRQNKQAAHRLLLAVLVSMLASLAQAEDADLARCLNSPTGSEQKQCTLALYQSAAEEMKLTLAGVLQRAAEYDAPSTDGGLAAAISASQRAFEAYRDAECTGVVGRGEGYGRMAWVNGCLAEKTRERIHELRVPFYQR